MKKVAEIRNEIEVYNNLLNRFIKTFDLNIFNVIYLPNMHIKELRDYHEVKDELYTLLISLKGIIKEYSSDYYAWKSVRVISEKIGIDSNEMIVFLNKNRDYLFEITYSVPERGKPTTKKYNNVRNWENEIVTEKTEMKKISSYQLFKEMQSQTMLEKIMKNTADTSPSLQFPLVPFSSPSDEELNDAAEGFRKFFG